MRLIFMGTPHFAVPTLNALVEAGHVAPIVDATVASRTPWQGKQGPVRAAVVARRGE